MPDTPQLPPRWRRLYAHVLSLELACPRCGRLWAVAKGIRTAHGYDKATGIFRCAECGYRAYVGVILWPAKGRSARAEDHVMTPGEAAEARRMRSAVTEERVGGTRKDGSDVSRRRAQVNVRCTCGEGCPVHQPGSGIDNQDDD